jgi:uncharacterized protein (TIGR03118 family)
MKTMRYFASALALALVSSLASSAIAQTDRYEQTNFVSDIPGVAQRLDSHLVNPWGIVPSPNGTIWIANNGTGTSTLYNTAGQKVPQGNPLVVTIPASKTSSEGGNPTGIVFNGTGAFIVTENNVSGSAFFIFVNEDGVISGWNPQVNPQNAITAVDHGPREAIYKGAALGATAGGPRLFVTNFHDGTVEIYDKNFGPISNAGKFIDPSLPAGFAPFGIANINGSIYVTYAKQDADKEDDVAGPGLGLVSVFDNHGAFIKRLITRDHMNAPWGLALAPANFGQFSGALLVGNFGNGRINAFDPNSGAFLGQLKKKGGLPLAIDGLWGLYFIGQDMFFTAGIADESHGLFGVIKAGQ